MLAALWGELKQNRRQKAEAAQDREKERGYVARISEVAADLRAYLKKLDELYRRAKDDPSESDFERARRAADRADEVLVPWKRDFLDYLDTSIGSEAVSQFHGLGTTVSESGAPGEHARTAYEAHRQALERLLARVEQGRVRLKNTPESSGDLLPAIKNFVFPRKP